LHKIWLTNQQQRDSQIMEDHNLGAQIFEDVFDFEDDYETEAEANVEAFYLALKMALTRLEEYAAATPE
jgi:hypothetical protein